MTTWCYDPDDQEFGWYWALFVGGTRVNGGLAYDREDGKYRGIDRWHSYRAEHRQATHYYDVETGRWYPKDELLENI